MGGKVTDADRLEVVANAIVRPSGQERADALAYLHRTGNADVAEVLGLVGEDRPAKRSHGLTPDASGVKVNDQVCPYCHAPRGADCQSAKGTRVSYHRDRIRAAKGSTR